MDLFEDGTIVQDLPVSETWLPRGFCLASASAMPSSRGVAVHGRFPERMLFSARKRFPCVSLDLA